MGSVLFLSLYVIINHAVPVIQLLKVFNIFSLAFHEFIYLKHFLSFINSTSVVKVESENLLKILSGFSFSDSPCV
jgi:hypothetical protein